ncbi:uncharacterized protein LOC142326091 [Lycorma delicatula]|uniref:uncharacterized protein LOC142326091 n=1 Tax=Lycorma delicatula TaxID=130591 RepID=UPI003F510920
MRVLLFTVFGLTLFGLAFSHHGNEEEHLLDSLLDAYVKRDDDTTEKCINNYIDNLFKKFLEKVRSVLQEHEPYPIPDLGTKQIKDKGYQVKIELTNIKEYTASYFEINCLKSSVFRLTEEFNITFPVLHLEGDHKTNGIVLGKKVNGDGEFNVSFTNLILWGKAYAHINLNGTVQIKQLTLDYAFETVTGKATGLKVKGWKETQINNVLNRFIKQYFSDNERLVSDTIADESVKEINSLLKGMSLIQLIEWIKHFISPSKRLV